MSDGFIRYSYTQLIECWFSVFDLWKMATCRNFCCYRLTTFRDTESIMAYVCGETCRWDNIDVNSRDVTKFAFEFDNVRTSNVFGRFEIRRIFSRTRHRIWTSALHDRHHMSSVYTHRPPEHELDELKWLLNLICNAWTVSYTHLTLPTKRIV